MIHVEDSWVVTSCNVAAGFQCFKGPCCLHLWCPTTTLHGVTNKKTKTWIVIAVKASNHAVGRVTISTTHWRSASS